MRQNPRMGVLLIQLGTPHDPSVPSVRRFLREFLSDPRVLDIPGILRFFLVNFIIAPFRARKSSVIYTDLWKMSDNQSPILVHTKALTALLNDQLAEDRITVHMAMRYQGPSIPQVLGEMRTAAGGGVAGINHVAHLSGAAAGVLLVVLLRGAMGGMERAEASRAGGA